MDPKDKNSNNQVYSGLLKTHGHDHSMGLGWSSTASQEKRFEVMTGIADIEGCSILDLGCGVGDLHRYLTKEGWRGDYHGVDICSQMIAAAKKKYPDVEFSVGDLSELAVFRPCDYSFVSGSFNWVVDDNEGFARQGMMEAFKVCQKGTAVNFLSSKDPWKADYLYYFDPDVMKKYAEGLASRVELREDYGMWDFTLYLYRE